MKLFVFGLVIIAVAMGDKIQIGEDTFDYDPNIFEEGSGKQPSGSDQFDFKVWIPIILDYANRYIPLIKNSSVLRTADNYLTIIGKAPVMGSLETVLRESYKFIRLADDLHEIKSYLNDIRLCFIALTISGYVGIIFYALIMCITKRRRDNNGPRRPISRSDEEMGMGPWKNDEGFQNTTPVPSRTPDYRYTRPQNRHFHPSLQTKLDSVDSPTKQQLIVENHTGSSVPVTGIIRENGGPGIDRISTN